MHPNKLIAIICLCDSFSFCQFVTRYITCGFGYAHYLSWFYATTVQKPWVWVGCKLTLKESYSECWQRREMELSMNQEYDNTVQQRMAAWYFTTLFFSYTSLFLNTTIIYDLKKVINNPF